MKKIVVAAASLAALAAMPAYASNVNIGFFSPQPVIYAPPPVAYYYPPVAVYRARPVCYAPVAYYHPYPAHMMHPVYPHYEVAQWDAHYWHR